MNCDIFESPIGALWLYEEDGFLISLAFSDEKLKAKKQETALLLEAKKQLSEYFSGKRKVFDLPLNPKGTDFQKKVWQALCKIPYGETFSYKKVAQKIGNEKACRAVGMANNKNPIAIIVPCHRVIGENGKLVGYAGGLDIKEKLLELEKRGR